MNRRLRGRSWFGIDRRHWIMLSIGVAAVTGLAVAADGVIDRVSSTRATSQGRIVRCGRPGGYVHDLARKLAVALDDGRHVTVSHRQSGRFVCGSRVTVHERVTPWGATWLAIASPQTSNP